MSVETWYLDTSAFIKLVTLEPETEAFTIWCRGRSLVSSDLLRTEAQRAVQSHHADIRDRCDRLMTGLALIHLTREHFDLAGRIEGPGLRSLDAIHLAAALAIGDDLAGLASYDKKLNQACRSLALTVVAPA